MDILRKRWKALYGALGLPEPQGKNLTRYYALIDLRELAAKMYGKAFAEQLTKGHALEFLFKLGRRLSDGLFARRGLCRAGMVAEGGLGKYR